MSYWITVYNTRSLGVFSEEEFLNAITQSDYETLCEQYGIDPRYIKPGLAGLQLRKATPSVSSFFTLSYGAAYQRPLVIDLWETSQSSGESMLQEAVERAGAEMIHKHLRNCVAIVTIELSRRQLFDLGLLLGYEIARWAASQGQGIMEGLDGAWYRLNRYQAFLPL